MLFRSVHVRKGALHEFCYNEKGGPGGAVSGHFSREDDPIGWEVGGMAMFRTTGQHPSPPPPLRLGEGAEVRFFQADVLREPLPSGYDAVISSLFLHHLTEEQAVALLRRMGAAGRIVLVNDLVRSRPGYLLAWLGTRLLSRSEVVHFDGQRSVEGAFTPVEARRLAEAAGLAGDVV